jgi:hypothetical protein
MRWPSVAKPQHAPPGPATCSNYRKIQIKSPSSWKIQIKSSIYKEKQIGVQRKQKAFVV